MWINKSSTSCNYCKYILQGCKSIFNLKGHTLYQTRFPFWSDITENWLDTTPLTVYWAASWHLEQVRTSILGSKKSGFQHQKSADSCNWLKLRNFSFSREDSNFFCLEIVSSKTQDLIRQKIILVKHCWMTDCYLQPCIMIHLSTSVCDITKKS